MKIDDLIILSSVGPRLVPISQIVTFAEIGFDDAELIMRPVNKAHAKRIAKSNGKWPDIECVQIRWKNTEPFLLIDGRHRLEAAKMLGMQNVRITIIRLSSTVTERPRPSLREKRMTLLSFDTIPTDADHIRVTHDVDVVGIALDPGRVVLQEFFVINESDHALDFAAPHISHVADKTVIEARSAAKFTWDGESRWCYDTSPAWPS